MGLLETRRMMAAGDLKLWLDFRAGHCANQAGYSVGTFDGAVAGSAGRFRTGLGYETSHDFAAVPLSLGYVRVLDNAAFIPPAGGMCLIASYMQSNADANCQIIGQGGDRFANASWQLHRTATQIRFVTSDGVAQSTFTYALAAVPGQIETVMVRYTGGTGANNCTITVLAPTPSASTGQIARVPWDIDQPVSVCCYSSNTEFPFMGTMRYCSFIRGAQTVATLTAVAAEMEAISWPDAVSVCDASGLAYDRAVEYTSRFGVDQSTADEADAVNEELSNSGWIAGDADGSVGSWRVATRHTQYTGYGGPSDVCKVLAANKAAWLRLPITRWSAAPVGGSAMPTLAAYGTWDFWTYCKSGRVHNTYLVYLPNGVNNDGYAVRITAANTYLSLMSGGVTTDLITIAAGLADINAHFRVTRTANGVWRIYYNIGAGWVYGGTANDATIVTSEGMLLEYEADGLLFIGNQRSDRALLKWWGVVNPL